MSGQSRKVSDDEAKQLGLPAPREALAQSRKLSDAEVADLGLGEAGHPGHDPYKDGPNAHLPTEPVTPRGTPADAAISWADTAALGAGPQIAGAMGAVMHAATDPMQTQGSDLDAYRSVRDDSAARIKSAENTTYGEAAKPLGMLSTPIPVKPLAKGATAVDKTVRGGLVGGGTGLVHGLATSEGDLTKLDPGTWKRALVKTLIEGGVGAGGGAAMSAALSPAESAMRSAAETQALRAAGLRGGIKNSVRKDLGLSNMTEARELGRQFLDEGLIPTIGSSEAVAKRATGLEGRAGNAKGAVLTRADTSGAKFDYPAAADAARARLDAESAVATDLSGDKASKFADAFERQGAKTPGSFVGADKAKSDAWKSARFDQDAPKSAQLYRKSVGATRDDIERQVGDALGPDAAKTLASSNKKYGVAADALKLAENASTRDAAKQGVTMGDLLALTTSGTAGGLAGHPVAGVSGGLGAVIAKKLFDKYGHSSASRLADFAAERASGGAGGVSGSAAARGALAPYLDLLREDDRR